MREAHNLEAYVEWFNRLGYLVAAEILRHDNKKARIKALEFFIQVGYECQQQHNFNSLMAIISALNFASVGRLKKTWDKLPSKYHQLYQQLEVRRGGADYFVLTFLYPSHVLKHLPPSQSTLDPSGNFRNYREEMSSLMHSSDVVPLFSLMVKVRAGGLPGCGLACVVVIKFSSHDPLSVLCRTSISPMRLAVENGSPTVTSISRACGGEAG